MRDLVSCHGAVHFEIGFSTYDNGNGNGSYFSASIQWLDSENNHGRGIATSTGQNITEALAGMLEIMLVKRGQGLIDTSEAIGGAK